MARNELARRVGSGTVAEAVPRDLDGAPIGSEIDSLFPLFDSFDGKHLVDADTEFETRDYMDMLGRDGKARCLEQVLTLPLRMVPWEIEPPASGDRGQTEFVRDVLSRPANSGGMSTPFQVVLGQMTGAVVWRKSFHEKVYTHRDGRVVLDKLGWRPTQTCRILRDKRTGAFRGFEQDVPSFTGTISGGSNLEPVRIPPHRALLYVHGTHRDPLRGVSDLGTAFWAHRTKQKVRFLWYQFLERQANPPTAVKHADEQKAKAYAALLVQMKSSGAVGVDAGTEFQAIESNGRGFDQFAAALRYLDGEMSASILAGFTDLTGGASEGRGSYALSKDQSDLFLQSRNAVAAELAGCINSFLVADLCKWNYGPEVACPVFRFADIGERELGPVKELLAAFGTAPQLNSVPEVFVHELVTRTATLLDLDSQRIEDAIVLEQARLEAAAETEAQARIAPVAAGVNVATREVQAAPTQPVLPGM